MIHTFLMKLFNKNMKNMSGASNDGQKPHIILIDADYPSDPLSTNEVFNKFHDDSSKQSNSDDL